MPTHRTDTESVQCPHCGCTHHGCDTWDGMAGEHECHECGRRFSWERCLHPSYNTAPLAICPVCKREAEAKRNGTLRIHYAGGQGACPGTGSAATYPPATYPPAKENP